MKLKKVKKISFHLLTVLIFVCRRDLSVCQFGIQLTDANSKILGTFCARNERDRTKFVDDLKEAILEVKTYQLVLFYETNSIHIHRCHLGFLISFARKNSARLL